MYILTVSLIMRNAIKYLRKKNKNKLGQVKYAFVSHNLKQMSFSIHEAQILWLEKYETMSC